MIELNFVRQAQTSESVQFFQTQVTYTYLIKITVSFLILKYVLTKTSLTNSIYINECQGSS